MTMPFYILVLLFVPTFLLGNWAVFYGKDAPADAFKSFELLVFDSDQHPPLAQFKGQNKTILGYISLGEVEQHRIHYSAVEQEGLFLGENPEWTESQYIDIRSPLWAKRVIEELIPAILFQRFDGIFLDTLDNATYLEDKDPIKYKGMREAAIHLVEAIRLNYPQIKIMMNRGFDLLPEVAERINMLVGESIYSTYNSSRNIYGLITEADYKTIISKMKKAQGVHPQLGIYSLDYWDPADTAGVKRIYDTQRKNGLNPYVSTRDLSSIYPEPK